MKPGAWPSILLIYWYGLLCTAQAGKMAPLVTDIEHHLSMSASKVGICVSAVVAVPALLGLVAGWFMENVVGLRRSLALAALIICAANAGEVFATDFMSLLSLRIFEGLGFVGLLVGAPALIIRTSEGKRRLQAMAGWSAILGLGFVCGLEIAAPFAGSPDFRGAFVVLSLLAGLSVVASGLLPRPTPLAAQGLAAAPGARSAILSGLAASLRSRRMIRVGASFGAQQIIDFGGGSVAPAFFMLAYGVSAAQASGAYAIAMFIRPLGGTVVAYLLGKGVKASQLAIASAALVIFCGLIVFSKGTGFWNASMVVIGFSIGVGAFSGITLALLSTADQSQAAGSSAIVNQLATVGSFAGPPLFFASLQIDTWLAFALPLVVFGCLAAALLPIWGADSALRSAPAAPQPS